MSGAIAERERLFGILGDALDTGRGRRRCLCGRRSLVGLAVPLCGWHYTARQWGEAWAVRLACRVLIDKAEVCRSCGEPTAEADAQVRGGRRGSCRECGELLRREGAR